MAMMVEQFGFAMMPSCAAMASGLISGITSGTFGSMRKAEELSTTTAPARAAIGANFFEIEPPALKNAMSMSSKLFSVSSSTSTSRPSNRIVLPADRADASSRSFEIGKCRSSKNAETRRPRLPWRPQSRLYIAHS